MLENYLPACPRTWVEPHHSASKTHVQCALGSMSVGGGGGGGAPSGGCTVNPALEAATRSVIVRGTPAVTNLTEMDGQATEGAMDK